MDGLTETERATLPFQQDALQLINDAYDKGRADERAAIAAGKRPDTAALDAACFSVDLHGDWRWLTRNMTTEEREAFADAADRHRATWPADEQGRRVDRWWRDERTAR